MARRNTTAADAKNTNRLAVKAAVNGRTFTAQEEILQGLAARVSAAHGLALSAIPYDALVFKPWHGTLTAVTVKNADGVDVPTGEYTYTPLPDAAQRAYDAHLSLWRGTVLGRADSRYPVQLSLGVPIGNESIALSIACIFGLDDDAIALAREILPKMLSDARRNAKKVLAGKLIYDDESRRAALAHIALTAAVLDSHLLVRESFYTLIALVDADAAVKRADAAVKRAESAGKAEDVIVKAEAEAAKARRAQRKAEADARATITVNGALVREDFFPTVSGTVVADAEGVTAA